MTEAVRLAFFAMPSSMDRQFTPRFVVELCKDARSTALKQILDSPSFWRTWGYKNKGEAIRLIGLKSSDGSEPRAEDLGLFRPLRKWAFDGKIDKKEFMSLRDDGVFRLLLTAVQRNKLPESLLWDLVEERRHGYELGVTDPHSRTRLELFQQLVKDGLISKDWDLQAQSSLNIYLNFAALAYAATDSLKREFFDIMSMTGPSGYAGMVAGLSLHFSRTLFDGMDLKTIPVLNEDCVAIGIDPSALVGVKNDTFWLKLEGNVKTLHDCVAVLYGSALGVLLLSAVHKRMTSAKTSEEDRVIPLTVATRMPDSHWQRKLRSCVLF
ncbi:hypothetical protein SCB29_29345 [Paraburkholderia sp. SIMBA_055]